MITRTTILTLALVVATIFSSQANKIERHQNALEKRNAKLVKTIADPKKSKYHLSPAAQRKLSSQFYQIEGIDQWNANTSEWDSIFRNTYQYNASGNLTLVTLTDVVTGPGLQIEYLYDMNSKVYEAIIRTYNKTNSSWVNSVRDLYTYDTKGRLVLRLYQEWDTLTNVWFDREREGMTFNSMDYMSMYLYELYDGVEWYGVDGVKLEYVFDSNDRSILDMAIYLDPVDQTWDTVDRMHHVYTSLGFLTENVYQVYENGVWKNFVKEEIHLDSFNVASGNTIFMYDDLTSNWDSTERNINMLWFNWTGRIGSSEPSEYTFQTYDGTNFVNEFRYVATKPDTYGSKIEERFMMPSSQWVPDARATTMFDEYLNQISFTYEMYVDTAYEVVQQNIRDISYNAGQIVEMIDSEFDPSTGTIDFRMRFRYSPFITLGLNKPEYNSTLNVYPNPTNVGSAINVDVTSTSNVTIEIYNLIGEKVSVVCTDKSLTKGVHSFNLNIPAGVYIVHTKQNEQLFTNKLIVE